MHRNDNKNIGISVLIKKNKIKGSSPLQYRSAQCRHSGGDDCFYLK